MAEARSADHPLHPASDVRRVPRGPQALLRVLSPGGARGRLAILIFHRVLPQADPLFPGEVTRATFRERMQWVRELGNVLPLGDAIDALQRGTLPARALAITFDDGYADNVTEALPILRELALHATFFVTTGVLDGGRMWNDTVVEAVRRARPDALDLRTHGLGCHALGTTEDRRRAIAALLHALKYLAPDDRAERVARIAEAAQVALPTDLMLSTVQLRQLASAGMGLGAHTVTHPILARLDDAAARREIEAGREALATIAGGPVDLFAYPNGKPTVDYRKAHVAMAKSIGFRAAVTTAWGAARGGDDRFELPRFTPWDTTPGRFAWRLARNHLHAIERAAT